MTKKIPAMINKIISHISFDKEFLDKPALVSAITHLRTAVSTKISSSQHHLLKEETAIETYGLIQRFTTR